LTPFNDIKLYYRAPFRLLKRHLRESEVLEDPARDAAELPH
jgi:hypothetical protein